MHTRRSKPRRGQPRHYHPSLLPGKRAECGCGSSSPGSSLRAAGRGEGASLPPEQGGARVSLLLPRHARRGAVCSLGVGWGQPDRGCVQAGAGRKMIWLRHEWTNIIVHCVCVHVRVRVYWKQKLFLVCVLSDLIVDQPGNEAMILFGKNHHVYWYDNIVECNKFLSIILFQKLIVTELGKRSKWVCHLWACGEKCIQSWKLEGHLYRNSMYSVKVDRSQK